MNKLMAMMLLLCQQHHIHQFLIDPFRAELDKIYNEKFEIMRTLLEVKLWVEYECEEEIKKALMQILRKFKKK